MPQSPFQGTYNPYSRPTVLHAPDAKVYINGELDIQGCPNCQRRFDLGKYITSVSVNLDVDSVPGSASISMSIPKYTLDDVFMDGVPIISPMMEVEIYAKGFYLVEGVPQYYPIFWGLITEVTDGYSGGEYTLEISCADILKWWEICRMNINPAFTAPTGQMGTSIFGNVLYGTNPYDVIFSLAQMAFGDVILGTGSLISLVKETGQQATFNAALGDIMQYWSTRFSRIRSNLLLYGVNGIAVRGDSVAQGYDSGRIKGKNSISTTVRQANGGPGAGQVAFDPTSPEVTAFRTQFSSAGEVNFWQSEYQTKLEIANACKEAIGFEFYMDATGEIVFKPPFYNLDIMSNKPISWIQEIDIIDISFSESESEVVTQLTIQGSFAGNVDYGFGPDITPFSSVVDYHLLRKYGWRPHTMNSEFLGDTLRMFYHGLDTLDRINSKRFSASVTIPFRPELRLGFPIYISHKDQIWYIRGIAHNIGFGGRATTQLTLTARRTKFLAPTGISILKKKGDVKTVTNASPGEKVLPSTDKKRKPLTITELTTIPFELEMGEAATVPPINVDPENPDTLKPYRPLILRHPKTGRLVGYPNAVMVYTRPYEPTADQHAKASGRKTTVNPRADKENRAKIAKQVEADLNAEVQIFTDRAKKVKEKYSQNRFSYGLNSAGVYVYAYDKSQAITQFSLLPAKNITVTKGGQPTKDLKFDRSTMVRPISDERGFEVIGHFPYGRGASLRDGSLVLSQKGMNRKTTVNIPLALSGSLSSTLSAQSQGLTTGITGVIDVADALNNLQPEDLQTAGVINPETKTPEFTKEGTNFVSAAPLGSMEQKGVQPSIEVSQLSKALGLAELTVRLENGVDVDPTCDCTMGRPELSFINLGYQVKPSTMTSVPAASDVVDTTKPVSNTLKGQDLKNKVEGYLFGLYQQLDVEHQKYENSLRGNPSGATVTTVRPTFEATGEPTRGDFSPPFSAMGRADLGDPQAIALQASSEIDGLARRFEQFGEDLKNSARKRELEEEIAFLRRNLSALEEEDRRTEAGTPRKAELARDMANLTQQLGAKQLELQIL